MRALIALVAVSLPLASGCAMVDGLTGGGCDGTPFFQSVNQTIPDNDFNGISSSVSVGFGTVDGVTISNDTYHVYPGELNYELSHNGFVVTLDGAGEHDVDDFNGMQAEGIWTMRIYDSVGADVGTWYSWEIAVCVEEGR